MGDVDNPQSQDNGGENRQVAQELAEVYQKLDFGDIYSLPDWLIYLLTGKKGCPGVFNNINFSLQQYRGLWALYKRLETAGLSEEQISKLLTPAAIFLSESQAFGSEMVLGHELFHRAYKSLPASLKNEFNSFWIGLPVFTRIAIIHEIFEKPYSEKNYVEEFFAHIIGDLMQGTDFSQIFINFPQLQVVLSRYALLEYHRAAVKKVVNIEEIKILSFNSQADKARADFFELVGLDVSQIINYAQLKQIAAEIVQREQGLVWQYINMYLLALPVNLKIKIIAKIIKPIFMLDSNLFNRYLAKKILNSSRQMVRNINDNGGAEDKNTQSQQALDSLVVLKNFRARDFSFEKLKFKTEELFAYSGEAEILIRDAVLRNVRSIVDVYRQRGNQQGRILGFAGEISGLYEVVIKRGTTLENIKIGHLASINEISHGKEFDARSSNTLFEFKFHLSLLKLYQQVIGTSSAHVSHLEVITDYPEFESIRNIVYFGELDNGEVFKTIYSFMKNNYQICQTVYLSPQGGASVKFSLPQMKEFLLSGDTIASVNRRSNLIPYNFRVQHFKLNRLIDRKLRQLRGEKFDVIIAVSNLPVNQRSAIQGLVCNSSDNGGEIVDTALVSGWISERFAIEKRVVEYFLTDWLKDELLILAQEKQLSSAQEYLILLKYDLVEREEFLGNIPGRVYLNQPQTEDGRNTTCFFRDYKRHWRLMGYIVNELVREKIKSKSKEIAIASFGCSNGAEAYSVAIFFNNLFGANCRGLDLKIRGYDNNLCVLNLARRGIYQRHSFYNALERWRMKESFFEKYFEKRVSSENAMEYRIKDFLRNRVLFTYLEMSDARQMAKLELFDIVFFKNVLIHSDDYFNQEHPYDAMLGLVLNKVKVGGLVFMDSFADFYMCNFPEFNGVADKAGSLIDCLYKKVYKVNSDNGGKPQLKWYEGYAAARLLVARIEGKITANQYYHLLQDAVDPKRKIILDLGEEVGLRAIKDVCGNLNDKFLPLMVEPGILMRLDDFIRFTCVNYASRLDHLTPGEVWGIRNAYEKYLGIKTYYRALRLVGNRASQFFNTGILAPYFIADTLESDLDKFKIASDFFSSLSSDWNGENQDMQAALRIFDSTNRLAFAPIFVSGLKEDIAMKLRYPGKYRASLNSVCDDRQMVIDISMNPMMKDALPAYLFKMVIPEIYIIRWGTEYFPYYSGLESAKVISSKGKEYLLSDPGLESFVEIKIDPDWIREAILIPETNKTYSIQNSLEQKSSEAQELDYGYDDNGGKFSLKALNDNMLNNWDKLVKFGIKDIPNFGLRVISRKRYKNDPEHPFGNNPELYGGFIFMISIFLKDINYMGSEQLFNQLYYSIVNLFDFKGQSKKFFTFDNYIINFNYDEFPLLIIFQDYFKKDFFLPEASGERKDSFIDLCDKKFPYQKEEKYFWYSGAKTIRESEIPPEAEFGVVGFDRAEISELKIEIESFLRKQIKPQVKIRSSLLEIDYYAQEVWRIIPAYVAHALAAKFFEKLVEFGEGSLVLNDNGGNDVIGSSENFGRITYADFAQLGWYEAVNRKLVDLAQIISPLREKDQILELGSGEGTSTSLLVSRLGQRNRLIAVELVEEKASNARERFSHYANIDFLALNVDEIKNRFHEKFSQIFAFNMIHLIEDKFGLMQHVRQLLTPKGVFVFNTAFFGADKSPESKAFEYNFSFNLLKLLHANFSAELIKQHSRSNYGFKLTEQDYRRLLQEAKLVPLASRKIKQKIKIEEAQEFLLTAEVLENMFPAISVQDKIMFFHQAFKAVADKLKIKELEREWLYLACGRQKNSDNGGSEIETREKEFWRLKRSGDELDVEFRYVFRNGGFLRSQAAISKEGVRIFSCTGLIVFDAPNSGTNLIRRTFIRAYEIGRVVGFNPQWAFISATGYPECDEKLQLIYSIMRHYDFTPYFSKYVDVSKRLNNDALCLLNRRSYGCAYHDIHLLNCRSYEDLKGNDYYHSWYRPLNDFVEESKSILMPKGFVPYEFGVWKILKAQLGSLYPEAFSEVSKNKIDSDNGGDSGLTRRSFLAVLGLIFTGCISKRLGKDWESLEKFLGDDLKTDGKHFIKILLAVIEKSGVKIIILPSQNELEAVCQAKGVTLAPAFYTVENNTMYIYNEYLSALVIAHEGVHALQAKYASGKMEESANQMFGAAKLLMRLVLESGDSQLQESLVKLINYLCFDYNNLIKNIWCRLQTNEINLEQAKQSFESIFSKSLKEDDLLMIFATPTEEALDNLFADNLFMFLNGINELFAFIYSCAVAKDFPQALAATQNENNAAVQNYGLCAFEKKLDPEAETFKFLNRIQSYPKIKTVLRGYYQVNLGLPLPRVLGAEKVYF